MDNKNLEKVIDDYLTHSFSKFVFETSFILS